MHTPGTQVSFQYRQHQVLGGALIAGTGIVIDWTMVGVERAYIIKPTNGGDVVHVRVAGVTPL